MSNFTTKTAVAVNRIGATAQPAMRSVVSRVYMQCVCRREMLLSETAIDQGLLSA